MGTETISGAASTIASLLLILGVLVACAYLAKRFRAARDHHKNSSNMNISILGARSLGGQQSLLIAEVGSERFLLGASRSGITLISRLDHHE